jgi:hypothetical protein
VINIFKVLLAPNFKFSGKRAVVIIKKGPVKIALIYDNISH